MGVNLESFRSMVSPIKSPFFLSLGLLVVCCDTRFTSWPISTAKPDDYYDETEEPSEMSTARPGDMESTTRYFWTGTPPDMATAKPGHMESTTRYFWTGTPPDMATA